jgi:hypothetical protein
MSCAYRYARSFRQTARLPEPKEHNLTQLLSFEAAVDQWQAIKRQLSALADQELELRLSIFAAAFPTPKEGANSRLLADGAKLKAEYPFNRKVDDIIWRPIRARLIADGIDADEIVRYKPDLAIGAYKKLAPDIRRKVDKAVTAKPGRPSLVIE